MMKRMKILVLVLAFALSGCGAQSGERAQTQAPAVEASEEQAETVWHYVLSREMDERDHRSVDMTTLLATTSYELPRLQLQNDNGEIYYADEAGSGVTAEQLRARDNFNNSVTYSGSEDMDIRAMAQEEFEWRSESGMEFVPFVEELRVIDSYLNGELLSVEAQVYADFGGPHPNYETVTWNYDLGEGTFFSWQDLTDDAEAMRSALSEEILSQIDAMNIADGLFEDYADTVRSMDSMSVFFNAEGMTVVYDAYAIAPYAAGPQVFRISNEQLAPLLNARGMRLLGL